MLASPIRYATLKEISLRLKSIKNIEKITKSMKMIATTKLARARRAMEVAKVIGVAQSEIEKNIKMPASEQVVFIGITSDRGLCGGVHSSISKFIKRNVKADSQIVAVGDKSKVQLAREHRSKIAYSFNQLGKEVPLFDEAMSIANLLLSDEKLKGMTHKAVYNQFKSVISYETAAVILPTPEKIKEVDLGQYENADESFQNAAEFLYASKLYSMMCEGHAAEIGSRRTSMENATKNAGEMIDHLTLKYNRGRQAAITNELCDIVTGAAALE